MALRSLSTRRSAQYSTPTQGRCMDLEEVWRIREEDVYPALFSCPGRGIFTLSGNIFTKTFGQEGCDPRWLFYGVIEFAPAADRAHWIYATSGHSNPWEQD